MADLAIGISKTVVEALVNKVNNAIKEEKELWKIVERDTLFMKDEFEMMQSFLKTADWEQVKNTVGRTWVRQVRELSYDAEDSVDTIVHLDTKRSLWTIWRRFWASCNCNCGAPSELELAVDAIILLKGRVEEVSNRNKRYSFIYDSGSMTAMSQQLACVPAIGTTAAAVDILTEAWSTEQKLGGSVNFSMLINESCDSQRVIALWGTRGDLGVTSIIKEAYEGEVIRQKYRSRAWLKLAYPFNPREFIGSLAEQVYGNSGVEIIDIDVPTNAEQVAKYTDLVKNFVEQIKEHRYLVVLEGLSNMSEWQAVLTYLPDNRNGSRIVVSTKHLEIARLCAGESYQGFQRVEGGIVHSGFSLQNYLAESVEPVGRRPDENELSDLISSASRGERPPVISVWGFPGVGKSSLVKTVLSRQEISQIFPFKWYVDVSYPFNLTVLCWRMLTYTQQDVASRPLPQQGITDEQIINNCIEFLNNHPGIVVIDGLRTKEDWDSIKRLIPEPSHTSSIIVVVTAEESVAKYCTVQDASVNRVKALEPDDAIELFEKMMTIDRLVQISILEGTHTFRDDAHMKKEANYILAKCGGIPKVIMTLTRYLGAQQGDIWQRKLSLLKANFIHVMETNPEFVSLRDLFSWMHLKFDALPWYLKRCILYEPVFSEVKRTQMRPSHFVRRWIAEGYSKCTNSKTMEDYAAELFNRLTKKTASMGEWRVNSFFHEYINSRLMEERAVFFPLVVSIWDKSRSLIAMEGLGQHLVIRSSWNRNEDFVFEDEDFSHLQSLTVCGTWKPYFIPYTMKSLRVLDLEGTSNIYISDNHDELQRMLLLLPRLRFLSLRGHMEIEHLPDSLYGLRHLQTLDIRRTSVVYIELQKLKKLQYLRAGTALSWMDDRGIAAKEESTASRNSSGFLASWLLNLRLPGILGRGPAGPCNGIKVRGGINQLQDLHTLGAVNINTADGMGILDEICHLRQLKKLELSGVNRENSKFLSKSILNQKNWESLTLQLEKDNHSCQLGGSKLIGI
ncbi:hypothetical protein HU200_034617 [Digitaria exilis]|uniref:Uncharacterized protein n=1 Tax=Digitaria exilis TaxID=1010633 RepID=A0A835BTU6_9POAL|nr:hypothetical protein HU200_034617 [Digitaria exilis]